MNTAPDVRGNVNPAMIINNENDAMRGIYHIQIPNETISCFTLHHSTPHGSSQLTERIIKGLASLIKNNDAEGVLLATQLPVTKSNPSYNAPHHQHILTPSLQ
jgi:hypothetical protein